jgi:hypothetical protein
VCTGGGLQVRSGFFVGKILEKFRFVVRTEVLQIGFEFSRASGVFQERDVWAITPYYHRILPQKIPVNFGNIL